MVPIRYIFRSRWAALAWAAGICWSAYQFAGGGDGAASDAANTADVNSAQVNAILSQLQ